IRRDAGKDQVLIRGHAQLAAVRTHERVDARAKLGVTSIGDAAGRNEQRQMLPPVLTVDPAKPVTGLSKLERARWLERKAEPPLELLLDPVDAQVVDRVLEPRVAAVRAVTMVALNPDGMLGDRD